MKKNKTNKVIFPKGEYYVGDPCYVIDDNKWDSLIDETGCFGLEPFSAKDENIFHLNGQKCWANYTMWGDGCYLGTDGNNYYVDAGLISIIPISGLDKKYADSSTVLKKDSDFEVWYEEGTFYFDNLIIETNY